jgi:beta-lactamase superfamily II metal-dependent hydrolase
MGDETMRGEPIRGGQKRSLLPVKRLHWLLLLLSVLIAAAGTGSTPLQPPISLTFIDIGQGDATLIQDNRGFDMLVDGGRKSAGESLLETLQNAGVEDLEVVIATHADSDHIGGLISLLKSDSIPIESVYYNGYPGDTLTWQEFIQEVSADGLLLIPLQYPETRLWGEFSIQVLNPVAGLQHPDQNQASIVLYISYAQFAVLLPADIDTGVEQLLFDRTSGLQADILKVAHHGSASSSSEEFLNAVQPKEAIISVGGNPYGHPAPETLARLMAVGTNIWRTDMVGTIYATSDGSTYQVLPRLVYLPIILQVY